MQTQANQALLIQLISNLTPSTHKIKSINFNEDNVLEVEFEGIKSVYKYYTDLSCDDYGIPKSFSISVEEKEEFDDSWEYEEDEDNSWGDSWDSWDD